MLSPGSSLLCPQFLSFRRTGVHETYISLFQSLQSNCILLLQRQHQVLNGDILSIFKLTITDFNVFSSDVMFRKTMILSGLISHLPLQKLCVSRELLKASSALFSPLLVSFVLVLRILQLPNVSCEVAEVHAVSAIEIHKKGYLFRDCYCPLLRCSSHFNAGFTSRFSCLSGSSLFKASLSK